MILRRFLRENSYPHRPHCPKPEGITREIRMNYQDFDIPNDSTLYQATRIERICLDLIAIDNSSEIYIVRGGAITVPSPTTRRKKTTNHKVNTALREASKFFRSRFGISPLLIRVIKIADEKLQHHFYQAQA